MTLILVSVVFNSLWFVNCGCRRKSALLRVSASQLLSSFSSLYCHSYCHDNHCIKVTWLSAVIMLLVELTTAVRHAVVILMDYDCISGIEYTFAVNVPLHANSVQRTGQLFAMFSVYSTTLFSIKCWTSFSKKNLQACLTVLSRECLYSHHK